MHTARSVVWFFGMLALAFNTRFVSVGLAAVHSIRTTPIVIEWVEYELLASRRPSGWMFGSICIQWCEMCCRKSDHRKSYVETCCNYNYGYERNRDIVMDFQANITQPALSLNSVTMSENK